MRFVLCPLLGAAAALFAARRYDWFNPFHLTCVALAFGVLLWAYPQVLRRLAGDGSDDETAAVAEPPPWPAVLGGSVLVAAAWIALLFAQIRLLEGTWLYERYSDRDLPAIKEQVHVLREAGNFAACVERIDRRLRERITPRGARELRSLLHDDLVAAGRQAMRTDGAEATAEAILERARRVAGEVGASPALADAYLVDLREKTAFDRHVRDLTIRKELSQAEDLLRVRMQQPRALDVAAKLAVTRVEALVAMSSAGSLEDRRKSLATAAALLTHHGLSNNAVAQQLDLVERETRRRQQFDAAVQSLEHDGNWGQVASELRAELVRAGEDAARRPAVALRLYDALLSGAQAAAANDDPAANRAGLTAALTLAREHALDDRSARAMLAGTGDKVGHKLAVEALQREQRRNRELTEQAAELARKEAGARLAAERVGGELDALRAWQATTRPATLDAGVEADVFDVNVDHWPLVLANVRVRRKGGTVLERLDAKDFTIVPGDRRPPIPCVVAPLPAAQRRAPLRVALVIDASSSMDKDERLLHAKRAAVEFLGALPPGVPVQVLRFATRVDPIGSFSVDRPASTRAVESIIANGETALYRAICDAADGLAAAKAVPQEVLVVMVLTDGQNTVPGTTPDDVLAKCQARGVRIYSIGLGKGAGEYRNLRQLAADTAGEHFDVTDPRKLADAFRAAATRITEPSYLIALVAPPNVQAGVLKLTIGAGPHAVSFNAAIPRAPQ